MKNLIFYTLLAFLCWSCSCEDMAKKTAKKATSIGISAAEGVAEAIKEHGDTLGQKLADATGEVVKGAGRSIDRQLNEHAEQVAAVAGRTLVQTLDGAAQGINTEFYDEFVAKETLCSDVSLDFFGKIKTKAVTDARFLITKKGTYGFKFEFCSDNCKTVVLTKTAELAKAENEERYTLVSFAYNQEEDALLATVKCVKVTVTRK